MKKPTIINLLAAGLLVCLAGVVVWRVFGARAARDESGGRRAVSVPVSIAVVAPRDMVERVTLTGVIRPRNEVDIFTKLPGRVEDVRVQVGDRVKEGQILAVIEHREIVLQGDQARAQLQAAAAGLERAKIGLEAASVAFKRYEVLRREGAVPQAEFERVESAFRDAQAGTMAAESQLATAKAAAALAVEGVRNSRITTPIAGTVTRRLVNVGTQAAPGAPLFQVQDVAVLKLESAASASDFARLCVGQEVQITVSDLPAAVFPGRVSTLSPSLDSQTRRAAVEITISNLDGRLLPNMFGQAVVEVGRRAAAVAVPENAVVTSPSGPTVFVVRGGRAIEVQPRLGGTDSGFIAVDSGIGEGDKVVVAGQTALRNGVAVRAVSETQGKAAVP